MSENGSYWWDKDTMKFFETRLESRALQGIGGIFFVTSEQPPSGKRQCTVRQFNAETLSISTVGEFCKMHRDEAIDRAKKLAKGEKHEA